MVDEYILRYFPTSDCPEGFGKRGRKGVGSVPLDRLEQVAEVLEREESYDEREELVDVIRYTLRKGNEINCGGLRSGDDLFTLSADVYIEVGKMKVSYGSVDDDTGHKKMGLREASAVSFLKSLSLPSLCNVAVFKLGLPVDPLQTEIVN